MIDVLVTDMMPLLAASNPVDHVTDKPIYGQWIVSNVTVMLILSAIATGFLIIPAAQKIATGEQRTLDDYRTAGAHANFVEFICLYLRDEIFKPMLGEDTDRFIPILWTMFWFILVCNVMGLVPILDVTAALGINSHDGHTYGIGGTATQSIWVTGALATISFLWYNGVALTRDPIGYLKHLTAGSPIFMWPIMVPVEIVGTFVKPVALALRLFANMTGGHIIVATLLGFVTQLATWKVGIGHVVGLIPIAGMIAVYMLELLVAFIQAFIFAYLSGMFLSQLVHHEHEHDDEHGHGEGHGKPAAAH